jgi:hypothetical protein
MCFKRSKEKPSVTPPAPILTADQLEIAEIAQKMDLRPDNRTPEQIALDIQLRNSDIIKESVKRIIKR